MIYTEPICFSCKHYDSAAATCVAFPVQIPDEIYLGDNDHKKSLPDQGNNIVFEQIKLSQPALKNKSLERRLQAYPNQRVFDLTTAYAKANEMKESEAVSHILKLFFDSMPESEIDRIIKLSKSG